MTQLTPDQMLMLEGLAGAALRKATREARNFKRKPHHTDARYQGLLRVMRVRLVRLGTVRETLHAMREQALASAE